MLVCDDYSPHVAPEVRKLTAGHRFAPIPLGGGIGYELAPLDAQLNRSVKKISYAARNSWGMSDFTLNFGTPGRWPGNFGRIYGESAPYRTHVGARTVAPKTRAPCPSRELNVARGVEA